MSNNRHTLTFVVLHDETRFRALNEQWYVRIVGVDLLELSVEQRRLSGSSTTVVCSPSNGSLRCGGNDSYDVPAWAHAPTSFPVINDWSIKRQCVISFKIQHANASDADSAEL